MCPIERSPRKDARPRVASIGIVASAALAATLGSREGKSAPPSARARSHRRQNVEHGLLAGMRLAARLDGFDGLGESGREIGGVGRDLLAQRQEQRPVKRAGGAPDLHHDLRADRFERFGQGLLGGRCGVGPHDLETAFHVDAVVAVADRLIEFGEFVGMRDHVVGHGHNQAVQERRSHARTLSPAALKNRGSVRVIATSSPGPSPKSGSARVTKSRSPRWTCK